MIALKCASPDLKKKEDYLYVKQNTEILNCICRLQLSEVLEVTLLIFSNKHIKMASLTLEINLICCANLLKFYCAITSPTSSLGH